LLFIVDYALAVTKRFQHHSLRTIFLTYTQY
jgi:hypothetical protein